MAHLFGIKLVCGIEFGACNFISFRSIQNSEAYAINPRSVLFVLEVCLAEQVCFHKAPLDIFMANPDIQSQGTCVYA